VNTQEKKMGAQIFSTQAPGKTAQEAFNNAVREAQHEYGHSGYTGSIAEKDSFVMIKDPIPGDMSVSEYAYKLVMDQDPRIDDKWGPAGCIHLGGNNWLFFGIASS
jgi:hypothetical protein